MSRITKKLKFMLQKQINLKNLFFVSTLGLLLFSMAACGESKSKSKNNRNSKSTTPDFTCINCSGHKFHYHETLTNLKVCNSCGAGQ